MKYLLCLLFLFSCATREIFYTKNEKSFFRLAWNKNNDPSYDSGNFPIALNSPLIYEDKLFVGHNNGKMSGHDLKTGRRIWSQKDNGEYHAAPVVFNDLLVYGTVQGRVYARSIKDGSLSYSVDLGGSVESQGVIYKGRILFHLRSHRLICLDASTGKILWAYKRSVPSTTTLQRVSRPIVEKGNVYIGFADGYVLSIRIDDGMVLWEQKISFGTKFVDVDMTPLLFGGKLIVGSTAGHLTFLNPKTGNMIRKIPIQASRKPLVIEKNLLVGTTSGEVVKLDRSLQVVMTKKISNFLISSLTFWKGKIVVSTVGHKLIMIDPQSLNVVDTFDLGTGASAVFGDPQVNKDYFAILSSRNRLYVFKSLPDNFYR